MKGKGLENCAPFGYPLSSADRARVWIGYHWSRLLTGFSIGLLAVRPTDGTRPFDSPFPHPGRLAMTSRLGHWLATTRQITLFRLPILSYRYDLKRVIVTPAVYPRLVEFLHFDIPSLPTSSARHQVSNLFALLDRAESPFGIPTHRLLTGE